MIPHRLFRFSGGSLPYDCVLTLRAAGPMKGRTDEENRARVFSGLGIEPSRVVSLTQIHSRTVYVAQTPEDFSDWKEGDGILTGNPDIVPCVTVADCMPIWLCHERAPCFGVLHSGWKGTGIIREALAAARRVWDADPAGFHVILGPHIRSCCYTVDDDRARYFSENFSPDAVCLDEARNQAEAYGPGGFPWRKRTAISAGKRGSRRAYCRYRTLHRLRQRVRLEPPRRIRFIYPHGGPYPARCALKDPVNSGTLCEHAEHPAFFKEKYLCLIYGKHGV